MHWLFTKTPLAFFVQNLWRDEAFTFVLSEQSVGNILRSTAADFNPPLYYLVMHYWMMIFGSSEVAMRSLSLLFYVLIIFILFEILVLVFKIPFKRALLYFSLIILNPVLLTYAFEARMYMMAAFFVTLSYFALWTGRKKLYIVATTFALYTHYFTALILLAQLITSFQFSIRKMNNPAASSGVSVIPAKAGIQTGSVPMKMGIKSGMTQQAAGHMTLRGNWKLKIIPIIFFLPWLLFLFSYHDFSSSEFWVIKQPIGDIIYLPFVLFTGYQRVFGEYYHGVAGYTPFHSGINILLWIFIATPIVFTLLKTIKNSKLEIRNLKLEIALWAFLPPTILYIVSLFTTPMYHPRYFMFSAVGFLLYLILSIESFLHSYEKRLLRRFYSQFTFVKQNSLLILIVTLLLWVTGKYNTLNLKYNAKRAVAPMFQEIDLGMQPIDKVYLTRELDYFLAKYYMTNDAIYIFDIPYDDLPSYIGTVLIPPTSIASGIPLYPTKAFIVSYNTYIVRSSK